MKRILRAFCMCLSNFTALPLPYRPWEDDAQELSLLCLPIVGAVLGFLWYLLALLLGRLLPAAQTALIVTLPWLLTGFMHLKGFLDTSDAIMTWRPLEQRMKALKDPRSGACAVAAMAVLALVSWGAAEAMPQWSDLRALVLIPVVSRCCMAFCALTFKPIGQSSPSSRNAGLNLAPACMWALELALCAVWLGGRAWVLVAETVAYAIAMFWGYRTLDGVSSEVSGFALTISECVGLVALSNQLLRSIL